MRFLILTQYFPPEIGAPQIRLAALARALKKQGHEIEVVTAMPNHLTGKIFPGYQGKFYMNDAFEGNVVRRTWVYAATGAGFARICNYLSFTLTCLLGLLRSKTPDYIFVESPPLFLGISGWMFSSLRRVPMIFNVADLWPDSVRELGVLRDGPVLSSAELLERWIYSQARFVSAATVGIQQNLINKKALPAAKVLFLPNGVDNHVFAPRAPDVEVLREFGLEGRDVFIYAGTHGLAQGLETVIDAADLVKNTNVTFLLVGDGPTKKSLVESAARRGLKNVVFVCIQPVEDMPKFFSVAVGSVAPLVKNELFKGARPSKIFPSLASGVPVIFCGEGEAAALLLDNDAGLVVAPENAPALAAAVIRLSQDRALQRRLGANGRRLVQEQFNWDTIASGFLDQLSKARDGATEAHTAR